MLRSILIATTFLIASAAQAQQSAIRQIFWQQIAPLTTALYCGSDVATLRAGDDYSIEHVYPRSWMRQTLGCQGDACNANPNYIIWENDLQNLMPADRAMNSARGDRAFGELPPSDDWRGLSCFRSRALNITGAIQADGIVEPRDADKGDIARILLYVHDQYGGLLPDRQLEVARRWSAADPASAQECARQEVIHRLQGTRNLNVICPQLPQPSITSSSGSAPPLTNAGTSTPVISSSGRSSRRRLISWIVIGR